MNVFDLVATLRLDSSQYESGLNEAQNDAKKGGKGIGGALGTAAKIGAGALAAAGAAAIGFAKSSVDAGMEFDKAMSQVAATMGYTVADINTEGTEANETFAKLNAFAKEMGRTTAFSASEAAEALNYMALAGYDADTSMEMLPTVLDLAAAGSMDLARASDMVTDAQSALGLTLPQTKKMVDQMAKASSKTNTSVEQLGEAILTIGATARDVKGGTTELATVLGVLADNGIKGSEGGTHLRNMILSLKNPTKDAALILKQLGISVYDSEGNMRSMIDIVGDLQTATAGMDQASRDAVINGLFNKTDLAAVNALLNTSQERFGELTEAIEGADGAAKEMAGTQLDNLAGDVTLWKSALEGAKIAISDALAPTLRKFVQGATEGLSELTKAFTEGGLKGALDKVSEWITEKSPILGTIFDAVREHIENTFTGIKTLWETILLPALSAFHDFLNDTLLPVVKTVWEENISPIIDAAAQVVKSAWEEVIKPALEALYTFTKDTLAPTIKSVWEEMIQPAIEAVSNVISAAWEGVIKPAWEAFSTFAETTLAPKIKKAWEEVIKPAIDTVSKFIETVWTDTVKPAWDSMIEGMNNLAEKLKTAWTDTIMPAWESLKSTVDTIKTKFEEFQTSVTTIWNGIKSAIISPVETAEATLNAIVERIKNIFNFSWSLPDLKLPHIKYDIITIPVIGQIPDPTTLRVEWYKKAYDNPYMFTQPTLMGFGDGNGGEIVYGHSSLLEDIKTAMKDVTQIASDTPIIVQCVLDGRIISQTVTTTQARQARAYG